MASCTDYVARAEEDKDFGLTVCKGRYPVWEIIAYFSSATYFINACFQKDGRLGYVKQSLKPHETTQALLDEFYSDISKEYERLYSYGQAASYNPNWRPLPLSLPVARGALSKIGKFVNSYVSN